MNLCTKSSAILFRDKNECRLTYHNTNRVKNFEINPTTDSLKW